MKWFKSFLIIFIFAFSISNAQDEQVHKALHQIAVGQINKVKMKLPDLLAEYPNDPGVQLLHGIVIEDGYKAVDKYMDIIVNNPESEWADDAYWRIVQFYAILGDTSQAKMHLANYRKNYPASEFLIAATDAVKSALFRMRQDKTSNNFKEVVIDVDKETTEKIEESKTEMTQEMIEESMSEEQEFVPKNKYGLQVGVYSQYEAAQKEVERFKTMRMLAEIKEKLIGEETMYAVVIGDYVTKESAENAKLIVQQQCKCIPIIFEK